MPSHPRKLEIKVDDVIVNAHVPKGVSEQSGFAKGQRVHVLITKSHVFGR